LAQRGDALAQYNLALELKNKNPRESFNWMHKSALKGYPPAQYEFGLMFHYGLGVRKNFDLARLWLNRSAKRGERRADLCIQLKDSLGFLFLSSSAKLYCAKASPL